MKNDHIIGLLERAPYSGLSERELSVAREHIARCADCRRVYDAARVADSLLKERAAVTFEPSPFFQTRMMAVLRERQALSGVSSLRRMWRAAGALVSALVALVALLVALTYFGEPQWGATEQASAFNLEFLEQASFTQDAPDEEMSYGQVLTTLYAPESDLKEDRLPKDYLEERNGQRQ
jgi:hypothetical protein